MSISRGDILDALDEGRITGTNWRGETFTTRYKNEFLSEAGEAAFRIDMPNGAVVFTKGEFTGRDPENPSNFLSVFSVTTADGTQYFEASAYYSSWDGVDWNDSELREVQRVEKTVIRYV
jgi:hypothetical protein